MTEQPRRWDVIGELAELLPSPSEEWDARYRRLMKDEYLHNKYNRAARLAEKQDYIRRYCPELIECNSPHLVVDVGCAMGEFLEICRYKGWAVMGVDASTGFGGMGDEYLTLSRMLTARQRIEAHYVGLDGYLRIAKSIHHGRKAGFINFQGSFAQCFHEFLDGPHHHEEHCASAQHWRFCNELFAKWRECFSVLRSVAAPAGRLLIVANRTGNRPEWGEYKRHIEREAKAAGWKLIHAEQTWIHKWERV